MGFWKVEGPVGMGIPGMDRDMLIFAFPGVAMRTTGPSGITSFIR